MAPTGNARPTALGINSSISITLTKADPWIWLGFGYGIESYG
jgi:hypothetical protein